jgi:hypothetical protein
MRGRVVVRVRYCACLWLIIVMPDYCYCIYIHGAQGTVHLLLCPQPGCKRPLTPSVVSENRYSQSCLPLHCASSTLLRPIASPAELSCAYLHANLVSALATRGQVCKVLPAELFERYEELLLQRGLNAMADVVFCPRCEVSRRARSCLGNASEKSQTLDRQL